MFNLTPTQMQPKQRSQYETECEICFLQNRIANNDGMQDVLMYQLEQLEKQLN